MPQMKQFAGQATKYHILSSFISSHDDVCRFRDALLEGESERERKRERDREREREKEREKKIDIILH